MDAQSNVQAAGPLGQRRVRIGDGEQRSERAAPPAISIPYPLSPKSLKHFEHLFPGYTIQCRRDFCHHPHPVMAYDRRESEAALIQQILLDYGNNISIVDIGGNALRHMNRRNVWSCCPILSPEDSVRNMRYLNCRNFCNHLFQDCACRDADVYISIHSIYYLTPSDVLKAVYKSTRRLLYSLNHTFDEVFGVYAFGEAKYHRVTKTDVVMTVSGNSHPYHHSNVDWLRSGYYREGDRAIAWSLSRTTITAYVFKFTACPVMEIVPVPPIIHFQAALNNSKYYGDVRFNTPAFYGPGANPAPTYFAENSVVLDDVVSVGNNFFYVGDKVVTYFSPKAFVSELATRVLGKPRDSTTYSNLIHAARDMIRSYDVPADMIPNCLVLSVNLAYSLTLDLEINSLSTMLHRDLDRFGRLNSLLSFQFSKPHNVKLWLHIFTALVLLALSISAQHADYHVTLSLFILLIIMLTIVRPELTFAGSIVSLMYNYTLDRCSPYNPFLSPIPDFFKLKSISVSMVQNLYSYFWKRLQMTVDDEGEEIGPAPMYKINTSDRPGSDRECLSLAGMAVSDALPVVHSSTQANELAAVVNRALKVPLTVEMDLVDEFCNFLTEITLLLLPKKTLSYSFKSWNNRYPLKQQKLHEKLYNSLTHNVNMEDILMRVKAFNKREKLLLIAKELREKDPRLIQGREPGYNVCIGPFIHKLSVYAQDVLGPNSNICYACGCTADEVGSWFKQVGHNNPNYKYFECDGARYDTTQIEKICAKRVDAYSEYCPDLIVTGKGCTK
jgi:hypothetical protein